MTIESMLAVLQAARDGKTIQRRDKGEIEWRTLQGEPDWNFAYAEFRVKPERREWWLLVNGDCDCGSLINGKYGWHVYDEDQYEPDQIHVREVLPGDEKDQP